MDEGVVYEKYAGFRGTTTGLLYTGNHEKVDGFLKDGKVSTIAFVTIRGLMEAETSKEQKDFLTSMDLTVAADSDILRAAGISNRNREREVENNEFLTELFKKLVRGKKSIYLLAENKEQLQSLKEDIRSYQENLKIVGEFSMDCLEMEEDYLVNEINMATPNVIISKLASPRREEFFHTNHMKLNSDIWLMVKIDMHLRNRHKNLFIQFSEKISKRLFKKKVVQYNIEQEVQREKDNES